MSMLMKELKSEIVRLARKVAKQGLAPVRRVTAAQRSLIADLRRQVVALEKEVVQLRRAGAGSATAAPAADGAEGQKRFWITGKGVRALRKRLGLTQAELGQLAGVSAQSVVKWESSDGKAGLRRKAARAALQQLRELNKAQARERLGAAPKKAGKPAKKVRKARKTK